MNLRRLLLTAILIAVIIVVCGSQASAEDYVVVDFLRSYDLSPKFPPPVLIPQDPWGFKVRTLRTFTTGDYKLVVGFYITW